MDPLDSRLVCNKASSISELGGRRVWLSGSRPFGSGLLGAAGNPPTLEKNSDEHELRKTSGVFLFFSGWKKPTDMGFLSRSRQTLGMVHGIFCSKTPILDWSQDAGSWLNNSPCLRAKGEQHILPEIYLETTSTFVGTSGGFAG